MPDMETGYCLDPEGNGVGLGGGGEAVPGPPEKGKDRQLKPTKGRDNMEKDCEEHSLFGRDGGGWALTERTAT